MLLLFDLQDSFHAVTAYGRFLQRPYMFSPLHEIASPIYTQELIVSGVLSRRLSEQISGFRDSDSLQRDFFTLRAVSRADGWWAQHSTINLAMIWRHCAKKKKKC